MGERSAGVRSLCDFRSAADGAFLHHPQDVSAGSSVRISTPTLDIITHSRSKPMVFAGSLACSSCSCGPHVPYHRSSHRRRCHTYSYSTAMETLGNDPIRDWILTEGKATQITRICPVGGGCINHASRYDTDKGSFFVKTNREIGPSMFEAEAIGLNAMYNTNSIRVPQPFQFGALQAEGSFIIMEFVEFGSSRAIQSVLGRRLAEMHKAGKSDKGFGFDVNNTIGSTPQINSWSSSWVEFFSEHRLGYQLTLVLKRFGDSDIYEKGHRLIKNMKSLFEGAVIEDCLLHGDLWSGNIGADKNGNPVIFDPACYYGHNEAEFGMSWCAGFDASFYNSYFEVMPKQPGFEKRRDLYMLYHYLNHYNLFGRGYRSSAMSIIDNYLRILKA